MIANCPWPCQNARPSRALVEGDPWCGSPSCSRSFYADRPYAAQYLVFYFRAFPFICIAQSDGESARGLGSIILRKILQ